MTKQNQFNIWQDPAKEIGEALLDEALEKSAPGLAKIPLLSTLLAAVQSGNAWSDYLLARKVQQFYSAWEQLPKTDRQPIYQKFQQKPHNFIEKLLFILDKQEDAQKCQLLGALTAHYLNGDIKRAPYYELLETVSLLTIGELQKLANLATQKSLILPETKIGERYTNTFVARGLLQSAPRVPREQRMNTTRHFQFTKLGATLAKAVGDTWH